MLSHGSISLTFFGLWDSESIHFWSSQKCWLNGSGKAEKFKGAYISQNQREARNWRARSSYVTLDVAQLHCTSIKFVHNSEKMKLNFLICRPLPSTHTLNKIRPANSSASRPLPSTHTLIRITNSSTNKRKCVVLTSFFSIFCHFSLLFCSEKTNYFRQQNHPLSHCNTS